MVTSQYITQTHLEKKKSYVTNFDSTNGSSFVFEFCGVQIRQSSRGISFRDLWLELPAYNLEMLSE